MGVNGAYNTVEENVGSYKTVYVRAVVEYCSYRRTVYVFCLNLEANAGLIKECEAPESNSTTAGC